MKVGPSHHELGKNVVITDDALRNIENSHRSIHAFPNNDYMVKVREIHRRRLVGEVTHQWLPGYEVNVKFSDGQVLQMKDNWLELAGPDAKQHEFPPQPKITMAPDPWDAKKAAQAMGGSVIKKWDSQATAQGLRTKREITIENFRNMGKLIVPKGTRVIINTEVSQTDGTWILVDAFVRHDAVFCGIRLEVDDIEPIASSPAFPLDDSPSP